MSVLCSGASRRPWGAEPCTRGAERGPSREWSRPLHVQSPVARCTVRPPDPGAFPEQGTGGSYSGKGTREEEFKKKEVRPVLLMARDWP